MVASAVHAPGLRGALSAPTRRLARTPHVSAYTAAALHHTGLGVFFHAARTSDRLQITTTDDVMDAFHGKMEEFKVPSSPLDGEKEGEYAQLPPSPPSLCACPEQCWRLRHPMSVTAALPCLMHARTATQRETEVEGQPHVTAPPVPRSARRGGAGVCRMTRFLGTT